jgi:hypothetical protein
MLFFVLLDENGVFSLARVITNYLECLVSINMQRCILQFYSIFVVFDVQCCMLL